MPCLISDPQSLTMCEGHPHQRFALAEGGHRDPQHHEGFLAPHLPRTIGEAPPRLIEVALSLL